MARSTVATTLDQHCPIGARIAMPGNPMTRRDFVTDTGTLALGAVVLPRHVVGRSGRRAPSDTLNFAVIGMGQQGTDNAESLIAENLVAVCDVDFGFTERQVRNKLKDREGKDRPNGVKLNEQFAKATRYTDFRSMLDRERTIDAVIVATPDHLHAVVAKAAMQMGRHVYVQKPLTWSVHEARVLSELARTSGLVTQMGNQGHSSNDGMLVVEWIRAGIIGPVHEVHIWTNRPIWPQGVPRPAPLPAPQDPAAPPSWGRRQVTERTAAAFWGDHPMPHGLDWGMYLGPVAEDIPFHPIYHPFNWRGWTAFGAGALGDMGAHLIDHPYWALELGMPTTIEATSTPWGGPRENPHCYPLAMTAHYEFPARGAQPPVTMHWYDGGLMPRRPDAMPETVVVEGKTVPLQLNPDGGVILVGEKGILMHETYGAKPQIFPESLRAATHAVPQSLQRIEGGHLVNFANACRGDAKASSPFEYAAGLTEVMLLGIAALRAGQGRRIHYDAPRMQFTNAPDANQYLTREYRRGWSL